MMKMKSKYYKPNKLLGQHFLRRQSVVHAMIEAARIKNNDIILEAGPGKGILTEALADKAGKVIAVEKDSGLAEHLRKTLANRKNIEIIEGDILKLPKTKIKIADKPYKIVANIPYYITSRFLRIFLNPAGARQPEAMIIMVQKEVAERITAKPPEMNLLALSVQVFGKAEIVQNVRASDFRPAPGVDSAIIRINSISNAFFKKNNIQEDKFFAVLKKAFSQKRKMLRSSLRVNHGKLCKKRPQELSLRDWIKVYNAIVHNETVG